jgi:hypothetical protein
MHMSSKRNYANCEAQMARLVLVPVRAYSVQARDWFRFC